ncbi:MAG: hypothetical protein IIX16_11175 [Clostridia bacterium]|nr:hypothetical protein [Clostridia bacterium]
MISYSFSKLNSLNSFAQRVAIGTKRVFFMHGLQDALKSMFELVTV